MFMIIVSFLVFLDLFGVIKNKYIPAFGYIITLLCTAFVFYKILTHIVIKILLDYKNFNI